MSGNGNEEAAFETNILRRSPSDVDGCNQLVGSHVLRNLRVA